MFGSISPGEQRCELHAQAAFIFGACVHFPKLPQGLVRLDGMPITSVLVNVGHLAALRGARNVSTMDDEDVDWEG